MDDQKTMVAIYEKHQQAEQAVMDLQKGGYDMTKLSIVGIDYHTDENVIGYYNIGDRVQKWGGVGAFWGSLWGILFGSAFFIVPGVGPLLIAGSFVAVMVGALEGALVGGGLSALGAALASVGIPKDSILLYETEIKAGKFMLLADGTQAEIEKVREILHQEDPSHEVKFTIA